jgi:hypothetical protein
MTIIAALNTNRGATWMGADSAASDETMVETRTESKVMRIGPWLFGSSPSFRVSQILMWDPSLQGILPPPSQCSTYSIVCDYVPCLQEAFHEEDIGDEWEILMGGEGFLWGIQSDYSVHQISNWTAIGSGSGFALGSLFYTHRNQSSYHPVSNYNKILYACQAAEFYSISVQRPFYIFSSEAPHEC